jgi:glycosyltransferase involved in cell wall biosynthesis
LASRPLKIVIPVHSLEPDGVERDALELAVALRNAGQQVSVVLGSPGSSRLASAPAIDCWHIPGRGGPRQFRTVWMIHSLLRYLGDNRVDVIVCPGNTYAVVGAAMHAFLGERCPPIALRVSNALRRNDMSLPMRAAYGAWLKVQGAMFDRIVGPCDPVGREICERTLASPQQVAVVRQPVLTRAQWRDLGRIEPRRASPWSRRFLAIGRLARQKNYPLMLRAFARAARPGDRLTILGEGPEAASLAVLVGTLGLEEQVTLAGRGTSVEAALSECDALLLSSDYEGLPRPVVMALAAGKPVIATDCSVTISGLLDEGRQGLLVPPGDPAAFADAIAAIDHFVFDPARSRAIAARHTSDCGSEGYLALLSDMHGQHLEARRRGSAQAALAGASPWHRSF